MHNLRTALFFITFAITSTASAGSTPTEQQLRAEDERLLSAVHNGGWSEWARVTTPNFIYVEEGEIMTRDQLLARMEPDGHYPLQIDQYHVTRSGDLALVVHHDEVRDQRSGKLTHSQYLMTETWQLIGGKWMLQIVHIDAVRAAPPNAVVAEATLDALVGTYSMGQQLLIVRRSGSLLVAQAEDEKLRHFTLEPETRDVFFDRAQLRLRWIFEFDGGGHVIGLRCRDENGDISVWSRAN
jgi:hypothetical protein